MTTTAPLWDMEPDRKRFDCDGYPCLILRHPSIGHLCGYIGVPRQDAPTDYNDFWPDVHGGWTFGGDAAPGEKPDGLAWFGFDCAHAGDLTPKLRLLPGDEYRDMDYVSRELVDVVRQLKERGICMEASHGH